MVTPGRRSLTGRICWNSASRTVLNFVRKTFNFKKGKEEVRKTNLCDQALKAGLVTLILPMIAVTTGYVWAQTGATAPDEHGAAPVAVQIKAIDELQAADAANAKSPEKSAIPPGVSPAYWNSLVPAGNEMTEARVALGKKLYFEKKLSLDGTVSCATCHDVTRGFGDALPTSEGVDKKTDKGVKKQFGTRNAPTTMNISLLHTMFWDGRSPSIEHQAMQPIINPVEMGMPEAEAKIIAGIKDDPEYQKMFKAAYNRDVNYKDIGNAIAVFERTFVFMDSPFFRFLQGDKKAISQDAKEGWKLFNREGRCSACHQISPTNPIGTDNKFHNIGIAAYKQNFAGLASTAAGILAQDSSDAKLDELALTTDMGELGRFLVTKDIADMGAFRTPMILNVGITGPYMHDGSLATLWDVVDHYNKGGEPNLYLDGGIEPLNLTDKQVDQLVAFLFSLTDVRFAEQNKAEFAKQKNLAAKNRPDRNVEIATRRTLSFEKYDAVRAMNSSKEKK